MKLGCTVSTYPTKFGPIVLRDGDLKKNCELLRKYGYSTADLFIKDTTDAEIKEYKALFSDYGLSLACVFAIYLGENGVCLSEKNEEKRAKNIDLFKRQLEKAAELDSVGLGLGFIRGGHQENETESDALLRIADCLHPIGEYAEQLGIKVLLEPINRYEINTLNKASDAIDFIRNNELRGVSLQLDVFHMNIEDVSIPDVIKSAKDLIGNIHVSSSNRYAVGRGHMDYIPIISALKELGYEGSLVFEGFAPDVEKSLKENAQNLTEYIKRCHCEY